MSNPTLAETLNELATAQIGRSETARLRDVFPEVERALAAGVSRQAVLDALHQDGFTMSLKTFEKALYRIRKRNRLELSPDAQPIAHTADERPIPSREPRKTISHKAPGKNRKPLTPEDFKKIRNAPLDLVALSKPVKSKNIRSE